MGWEELQRGKPSEVPKDDKSRICGGGEYRLEASFPQEDTEKADRGNYIVSYLVGTIYCGILYCGGAALGCFMSRLA